MKQRLVDAFPLLVAAALPVAGLVLAGARVADGDRHQALVLLMAALLGVLIWGLALSL